LRETIIKVMSRISALVDAEGKPLAEGEHNRASTASDAAEPLRLPPAEIAASSSSVEQVPNAAKVVPRKEEKAEVHRESEAEVHVNKSEAAVPVPAEDSKENSKEDSKALPERQEKESQALVPAESSMREGKHSAPVESSEEPPAYHPTAKIVQDLLTFFNKKYVE
jgi:hypothetical protein